MEIAGVSTAVRVEGSGPPMVLLHGPGAHGGEWDRVVPDLARQWRVVVPDLPGQGRSTVDGPIDADLVFDWLDALIDGTCPAPPVLVGHLIGGAIAARYAAADRRPLAGLVLVIPFGLAPFAPAPEFGAALSAYLTAPDGERHDALWRLCVADLDGVRASLGPDWDRLRAYNLSLISTPAVAAGMQALMDEFGWPAIPHDVLREIAVPTSLIWGNDDTIVPVAVGRAASTVYGWPLTVVEGAGNEPAIERPAAFLAAMTAGGLTPTAPVAD
jgi:pimeloyl-ACP methyl ester carboxylesterase